MSDKNTTVVDGGGDDIRFGDVLRALFERTERKTRKKRNVLDVCVYLLGLSGDMRSMWLGVVLSFFRVMLSMTGKIRSLVQIRKNCPVHSKLQFFLLSCSFP